MSEAHVIPASGSRRTRRSWVPLLVGCLLALTGCAHAANGGPVASSGSEAPSDARVAGGGDLAPGTVCPKAITIAQAGAVLSVPLLVPDDQLARGTAVDHVWQCPSGEVVLEYGSGVDIAESTSTLADPAKEWQRLAEEYPEFSVGQVLGVPASLADPSLGAIGGVDLVLDGGRYVISGNGKIPLSDLIRLTDSMSPQS
jgi:hypothetical protein